MADNVERGAKPVASKATPAKKNGDSGKKPVTKVEAAVEPVAVAKVPVRTPAVRKAGTAATPVVAPTPVELSPVELSPVELTPVEPAPVELTPVEPAPVEVAVEVEPAPEVAAPVEPALEVATPVEVAAVEAPEPVATPAVEAQPAVTQPAVELEPVAEAKPVEAKAPKTKPTKPEQPAAAPLPRTATASRKEYFVMTTATTEYAEKFQTAIKEASEKAKAAFEKSQASFGELGEFTKGNVEALVESSKILTSGLQELSKGYLTEGKSKLETLTAEIKELVAAKSPSELLEKQSTLLRKHFDAAVAASSKNSEAVLKLANEAFQPISNRVSLAVEKVKTAA